MSRITKFLKLYLPNDNDYYRVEEDQNENFEKIDKKLGEWDTGKEPAIKYKKTGFNLDKTDSYEENNANKLATARALYLLWEAFKAKIKAIKLTWEAIEDKPLTFPPSSHNHDDTYYTQTKSDNKLNGLAGKKDGTFPLSSATKGNVYLLESTHKYYMCVQNYNGYTISVPNSNFIEMSVYENLNRLNNLFDSKIAFCGLVKYQKRIKVVDIPSKAKYIWFYDSQSYPSYGFVYSHFIELDSYGNGKPGGYFEVYDIRVQNYRMEINFESNTDNALLIFALW